MTLQANFVLNNPAHRLKYYATNLANLHRPKKISNNQTGTQAKDTFMTVVQTAKKLGVNILDYMKDRFSEAYAMPSLADLIRQRTQTPSDTS